jgi:alkanesulfonate monooxygenase SsuD/methylene tetrahydromethanopterin reductase-like flavin-dependent oxidoreductase (luciferase family)
MHDIKYFFSMKIIRQFREAKIFSEGTDYRKYYLKTLFFKIQEEQLPPWPYLSPPLIIGIGSSNSTFAG